jgi:serine/threonine protein kinase
MNRIPDPFESEKHNPSEASTSSADNDMLCSDEDDSNFDSDATLIGSWSVGSPLDGLLESTIVHNEGLSTSAMPPSPQLDAIFETNATDVVDSSSTSHDGSRENDRTVASITRSRATDLRRIQSSPLVRKLSRKSMVFDDSTVVRRPAQIRPGLDVLEIPGPSDNISAWAKTETHLSMSSFVNNSISPVSDPSTDKTSPISDISAAVQPLYSSITSISQRAPTHGTEQYEPGVQLGNPSERTMSHPFAVAVGPVLPLSMRIMDPKHGVALIEKVASTKVFFETFYEDLSFQVVVPSEQTFRKARSPRSLRRLRIARLLHQRRVPSPECRAWGEYLTVEESNHLRKIRALKTRKAIKGKDISTAGYEVVRAVGKGSFGVVNLVRETRGQTARSSHCSISRSRRRPVFAMKVIKKAEMLRSCQEAHLRAERDFLVASMTSNSRWVVPLVASFQDNENLYLVMEFQVGGDFLGLLQSAQEGILPEEIAKFYIAQMILSVEETHRYNWIHRDIKPDNFLISASGHLKISDFGLAFDGHWAHAQAYYHDHRHSLLDKLGIQVNGDEFDRESAKRDPIRTQSMPTVRCPTDAVISNSRKSDRTAARMHNRKLARSIVGTSQYMAPEVVQGRLYDGRCDWWSIGIILFECLFGCTPFFRNDRDATKRAIVRWYKECIYPADGQPISYEVKHLLDNLNTHRRHRIGHEWYFHNDFRHDKSGRAAILLQEREKLSRNFAGRHVYPEDATSIKRHPFFASINWDTLHLQRPPFIPKVKGEDETKYFDKEHEILADCSTEVDEADAELNEVELQKLILKKLQKRPRCKLLRDPQFAQTVMDQRKKGAFLGYTWRRPPTWALGDDTTLDQLNGNARAREVGEMSYQ